VKRENCEKSNFFVGGSSEASRARILDKDTFFEERG